MMVAEIQYRNIAMVLAILTVIVALGFALLPVMRLFERKLSGWAAIKERFPAKAVQKTGEAYRACGYSAGFRCEGSRGPFNIEFAGEGLLVTASFARSWPILIPWSCIRGIASTNMGSFGSDVTVYVEYEKPLGFHLPIAALPTLQKHLPAERINQTTISTESPAATLEGIIDLARNRPK